MIWSKLSICHAGIRLVSGIVILTLEIPRHFDQREEPRGQFDPLPVPSWYANKTHTTKSFIYSLWRI